MRTELWGLRDKETHEPIYTYWASSNKYRALFAKKETAENACRNPKNPNMEPFCITGDPIRVAGGCYCGECRYKDTNVCPAYDTPMRRTSLRIKHCSEGEPREAQKDG